MKNIKDFIEALCSDEEFAGTIQTRVREKCETEGVGIEEATIVAAAEEGYEITAEELQEIRRQQAEVMNEEELGKVAGGASCLIPVMTAITLGTIIGTASHAYFKDNTIDPGKWFK